MENRCILLWGGLLACCICAGCAESVGMNYNDLPAEPVDETLVSAEARWAKILTDQPPVGESETLAPTTPADESNGAGSTDQTQANSNPVDGGPTTSEATTDPPQAVIPMERIMEGDAEPMEPREMKLLIPDRTFVRDSESGTIRVSYDDIDLLKILNMEPVPIDADKHFPDWLANLNGQKVRIRGWMIPPFKATGLKRFQLARDNGICCFVRLPKIYDVIDVKMTEGQTTDFISGRPFDVEGIFEIVPEADEEELYGLYRIRKAVVLN